MTPLGTLNEAAMPGPFLTPNYPVLQLSRAAESAQSTEPARGWEKLGLSSRRARVRLRARVEDKASLPTRSAAPGRAQLGASESPTETRIGDERASPQHCEAAKVPLPVVPLRILGPSPRRLRLILPFGHPATWACGERSACERELACLNWDGRMVWLFSKGREAPFFRALSL